MLKKQFARWFAQLLVLSLAGFSALVMAAVDVNSASATDLDSIKGIGPSTASKILDARKTGAFKDWTDFTQRVSGIGEARAAKLSEQGLRVNGAAYKAVAGTTKNAPKTSDPKTAPVKKPDANKGKP